MCDMSSKSHWNMYFILFLFIFLWDYLQSKFNDKSKTVADSAIKAITTTHAGLVIVMGIDSQS